LQTAVPGELFSFACELNQPGLLRALKINDLQPATNRLGR